MLENPKGRLLVQALLVDVRDRTFMAGRIVTLSPTMSHELATPVRLQLEHPDAAAHNATVDGLLARYRTADDLLAAASLTERVGKI